VTANAVIVHGRPGREEYYDPGVPSCSNHHWLPWLAKQLRVRDIHAHTPEMPHAYAPQWSLWRREFERCDIGPETILVGHSCGGGFLVRWLSEHPRQRVGRVVLVAPWIDPDGNFAGEQGSWAGDFFAFEPDRLLAERTAGLIVMTSDDDSDQVLRSVAILREKLAGAQVREFPGYGHFLRPQLREVLVAALG
jgi:predicted alpha/beta hydrolase family esterase